MTTVRVETLAWVLLYGGLLLLGLGLSVRPRDGALGWGIAVAGGLIALGGVTLIYIRSRMKGPRDRPVRKSPG